MPVTGATSSEALTAFDLLNIRIVGSDPARGVDICACLFCICDILSKESYRLCTETERVAKDPTKGCKAIFKQVL
jgi:hypothetical protein